MSAPFLFSLLLRSSRYKRHFRSSLANPESINLEFIKINIFVFF
ncbi:hypothetical protein H206_05635 [Candidatus Electrothrix aarhusensis]|uniref:Uncharacterized protein n=1 Tax=Candidatus Electrothrix aarhusensis TaxID=1859131 RepID=A0A444J3N4_9BACT|nr:hypothetical protein H206_05635 [Candidatus Electrothrix aarhusensis]